jgi:hypothetical protein
MPSMRWAWLWASALAASTLFASTPGFARVATRLVYARTPAASDCPDESALAAAVAARLGYEPFSPWGDQTIVATVTRSAGALVGHAQLIDHDGITQGSREVRNPECHELILALALAISITLDPLHVAAPAPEAAEPPAAPEPSVNDVATPPIQSAPVVTRPGAARDRASVPSFDTKRERVTWHIGAAAIAALEAAPDLAFGGRLALAARRGRWSLGVEGWTTLPAAQAADDGGEVQVTLVSAAFAPCFRVVGGFSLCGLGSLGSLRAKGQKVDSPRAESVLHATAGGRGLLAVPLGSRFELIANLDVTATLNRPRFQLDNAEVWRPGPLAGFLGIGAAVRFF